MSDPYPFLTLEQPCNEAVAWVVHQVSEAGLQVIRTFDLQAARHDHAECLCPHHGSNQCDCQLVVLLVYRDDCRPVSLVAHSFNGKTWLSLVDTPQQWVDPDVERVLRQALPADNFPHL